MLWEYHKKFGRHPSYVQTRNLVTMATIYTVFTLLALAWYALGAEMSSDTCRFQLLAKNYLPSINLLASLTPVRSSVHCASLCRTNFRPQCVSSAYSRMLQLCHVFSKVHGLGVVAYHRDGFNYYQGCSPPPVLGKECLQDGDCSLHAEARCCDGVCQCRDRFYNTSQHGDCLPVTRGWVGDSCVTHSDCVTVTNTECRQSKCACVVGYHYSPCAGTCVAACQTYGTGFYSVLGKCLNGNNEYSQSGLTSLSACRDICLGDPQCRSFEFRSGDWCHVSYTTRLEQPAAWQLCSGMDYHQRECA